MSVWERFNNIATADEVNNETSSFTPIEAGKYEARLELLEAGESKLGLPQLKARFRTSDNRVIFLNINLQTSNPDFTAKNIAEAVVTVEKLLGEEITFTNLSELEIIMGTVPMGGKYLVDVTYNNNYSKAKVLHKVEEVDGDGFINIPDGLDEELPFN